MSESMPVCEKCGGPAIVHIRSEAGEYPDMHHFCMGCAALEESAAPVRSRRRNEGAVLIAVGLFTFLLSVFADQLKFGRSEGFGWKQFVGAWIGMILVGVGAIMRIATVLVIGLIFTLLTVLADWLGFGSKAGFGWQQMCGTALGAGLAAAGLVLAGRRRTARGLNGGPDATARKP